MTSFKRWLGAGAIVVAAFVLIACPGMVPKVTSEIPDMNFSVADLDAGKTQSVTLANHFDVDRDPEYKAVSAKTAVATVAIAGGVLTVTPVGSGTTEVTVTASKGGDDPVSESFSVTVAERPIPPANNAPEMRTINNVSLDEGDQTTVDLADYTKDEDGDDTLVYGAQSLNPAVATVSPSGLAIPGSVITITAVSGGEATIAVGVTDGKSAPVTRTFIVAVTAPSPDNRDPVLLTSNLIPHVVYSDFRIGATKMYDLSTHFQDPDADTLTYGAESADSSVASITGDANTGMFTLTAVGKGDTSITVMAMDPLGASAQQTFNVGVGSKAPTTTTASTDVDLKMGGVTSRTFDLDDYFEDDLGEALDYDFVSNSNDMYAKAVLDGSMLTITAVAAGDTTVTVSAKDSDNDPVELAFMVMVHAEPDAPNNAPTLTDMDAPTVALVLEDSPSRTLDVSDHFMDADGDDLMYDAESSDDGKVTESVSGSMVTITAVAVGSATITVTASDGNGGSADLMIMVTVTAPDNMKPEVTSELPDLRIQIVDSGTNEDTTTTPTKTGTDNDTRAIDGPGDAADNKSINLSMYFEDPDGILLFFKVEKTEAPDDDDNKPVIDLHSVPATDNTAASGTAPDGTDEDETMVVIEPRNPGTATVTVTATDNGKKKVTDTFTVTVFGVDAVEAPTRTADTNVLVTGGNITTSFGATTRANRIKVGDTKDVIKDQAVSAFFTDGDFAAGKLGDMLTLSVKYFPATTTQEAAADGSATALAADKAQVSHILSKDTWNGDDSKFSLTITGERGSTAETPGSHVVALIATDTYGHSVAHVFSVRVNHKPKAQGPQSTPKILSDADTFHDLTVGATTATTLAIIDNSDSDSPEGYFSDGDGLPDLLETGNECRADLSIPLSDSKAPLSALTITRTGAAVTLSAIPDATVTGTMYADVKCSDGLEDSNPVRIRFTTVASTSGSQQ